MAYNDFWTYRDWVNVASTNKMARNMRRAQERSKLVAEGSEPALLLSGAAGCGKTFAITKAIQGHKVLRKCPEDWRTLMDAFWEAERTKSMLVFEESDQILTSQRMLNILKNATDPDPNVDKRVGHKVMGEDEKREKIERPVNLNRRLLFSFNTRLSDLNQFPPKLRGHITALKDRGSFMSLEATREDSYEYACHLAICHRLGAMMHGKELPIAILNTALRIFTENFYYWTEVSPRRFTTIVTAIWRNPTEPQKWDLDLDSYMDRSLPVGPVLPIPRMFTRKEIAMTMTPQLCRLPRQFRSPFPAAPTPPHF